jgi:hypothetical protein
VEYSEAGILKDTKNILYQNFVGRYCKQMQVSMSFRLVKKMQMPVKQIYCNRILMSLILTVLIYLNIAKKNLATRSIYIVLKVGTHLALQGQNIYALLI